MQLHKLVLLLGIAGSASAQKNTTQPNSLSPGVTREIYTTEPKKKNAFYSPRKAKVFSYKKPNIKRSAQYEFYERVEKVAKEKQRIMKKLSRRSYSDPRYFGHKRMPKRRPPHKMRYCDECSIRH